MTSHLTESERQAYADGSMPAEERVEARAHLGACAECASDVRQLESLMRIVRTDKAPAADMDGMWTGVRSRIETAKVVPLPGTSMSASQRRVRRWMIPALAVAGLVMLFVVPLARRAAKTDTPAPDQASALVPVTDSLQSYEEEARILLNHLEIQRALMRPEAAAVIDRDLKVIDSAIDELKLAIANDPRNPSLRRLLAASYRQKVELLKRAGNAG